MAADRIDEIDLVALTPERQRVRPRGTTDVKHENAVLVRKRLASTQRSQAV
jgi:hypothetical protein